MLGLRKTSIETYFLWYRYYCYSTVQFKWRNTGMSGAGAGAGAEIIDKGGAGAGVVAENK